MSRIERIRGFILAERNSPDAARDRQGVMFISDKDPGGASSERTDDIGAALAYNFHRTAKHCGKLNRDTSHAPVI